jgi:WD40 repeat protein
MLGSRGANKVIRHYHGHLSGVYALSLHPTLDILVTSGRGASARVWDMRTKVSVLFWTLGHTRWCLRTGFQKGGAAVSQLSLRRVSSVRRLKGRDYLLWMSAADSQILNILVSFWVIWCVNCLVLP